MKSLSVMTCVALFLCTACTKIVDKPTVASQPFSANASPVVGATIENLGTAITGTNVFWKINPEFENIEPLFTMAPNSTSGLSLLMIDNGNRGTAPLRFISVNLQTNTSKTIHVTDKSGAAVTQSLGRITRYIFGMNKKFYVATENGGHVIEYDPFTQTAKDLGQPFNIGGRIVDIYSLSVGKDGALYGGSFGGSGDVFTFRYDYTNFSVDKTNLDNESRYVTAVTGDDKYTYATCGQNAWKTYAIERATGKKTLVLNSTNPSDRIYSTTSTDACYAQLKNINYKLTGATATAVTSFDKPAGARVAYMPYQVNDPQLPKVMWSEIDRKLYYQFPGAAQGSVKVNDVIEEVYAATSMSVIDNKLFITGGTIPRCVSYQAGEGFNQLGGTSIGVFAMAVVPGTGGKKIVMGGYPKGALLEYNMNTSWNLGIQSLTTSATDIFSTASNPRKIAQLQDADHAGVFGPMMINGIFYTKDGTLIAAGNNDRLTESASRELGIGTYKNGIKKNFTTAEMRNYEFQSMTLSHDSTEVYISAMSKYGGEGKIFRYNPATNAITSTINFPADRNPGNIQMFKDNLIAGVYNDVVYLMDVNTKNIVWKSVLGGGQRINTFKVAPDGNIWISHNYLNAFTAKIVKMQLDTKNLAAITATTTEVSQVKSPDNDEAKPTSLAFMKSQTGNYDLYIAGFKSVCRIKSVISQIN